MPSYTDRQYDWIFVIAIECGILLAACEIIF